MQIFLIYLFLFLVGSFLGWILEVVFRKFFTVKKLVNPGFMKGPWLPLYGFGVILMFSMCYLCVSFFPESVEFYNPFGLLFDRLGKSGPTWYDLIPISLMWISMVGLEFIAGLIFIKGFHVKLWDYTNMKGNIMGIICPVFNFLWLMVAVIFYYGINPFLYEISTHMHEYMFGSEGAAAHFGFIFFLGVAYGVMLYDFVKSIGLFTAVSKFAKESGVLDRYEVVAEKLGEVTSLGKRKLLSTLGVDFDKEKKTSDNGSSMKEKIAKMIYIDPEKEKDKDKNYDENGRPIKMDDHNN